MHAHQCVDVDAGPLQAGSLRRSREPGEHYQSGQSLHTSTSVPEWRHLPLWANYVGNFSTAFVPAVTPPSWYPSHHAPSGARILLSAVLSITWPIAEQWVAPNLCPRNSRAAPFS